MRPAVRSASFRPTSGLTLRPRSHALLKPSKFALSAIGATFTNNGRASMGKPRVIHTDGEDLVVMKRSDYEALRARAGDEASEDVMTARIIEASDARIARGE